ncbi:hypothetical protein EZY14_020130 [Kordia sp. TARA_039_SRF]|nr:hypothetical protein EZY14_020130 [Kordia sp. TARA_039_SRF]MAF32289.1 hypothetical protein [Magnetococcales bacterium]|tara:strand:- start:5142 stop:5591 length:450 start_codon:yes stop_codon:yes gene_type:complete
MLQFLKKCAHSLPLFLALGLLVLALNLFVVTREGGEDTFLKALRFVAFVGWSLVPACLIFVGCKRLQNFPSLRFAGMVTGWANVWFLVLFSLFVTIASLSNPGGLKEAAMVYIVPISLPLGLMPKLFVVSVLTAWLFLYVRRKFLKINS